MRIDRRTPEVLFVGAFPPADRMVHGGMVTSCRALIKGGLGERLELTLVDTTQRSIPPPPVLSRTRYASARVLEVLRRIERQRPDALMLFATIGLSIVEKTMCAWYAARRGVPSILFFRGGSLMVRSRESAAYRLYARTLMRVPTRIVCQSVAWQRFFVEELGVSADRCTVIENWTADDALVRVGATRTYEAPADRPLRVLYVGWVERAKGVMELMEAASRLARRPDVPPFVVTLCGSGRAIDEARAVAEAGGIADRMEFSGWVDGDDLVAAYAAADVFTLPSYAEGLPNAMIEAMAAGLPIVVTPVGAVPDVVDDGRNGRIVPTRDVSALERALADLLSSAEERARLGRAAHADAQARFSAATAVARIESLVHALRK